MRTARRSSMSAADIVPELDGIALVRLAGGVGKLKVVSGEGHGGLLAF